MSQILIKDLRPAGADLFSDSESFLNELSENQATDIMGGIVIITKTDFCLSGRRCVPSWNCFAN